MPKLALQVVAGEFAICRLSPSEPVPAWSGSVAFCSVTRTVDELSVVCPARQVPSRTKHESGWRLLKLDGPFDFGAVGILASVLAPLATTGISALAIASFDTDHVLVKADRLDAAVRALEAAGHLVRQPH
jgi:hypothetical protein